MDIYENVPVVENERWKVRFLEDSDAADLFAVYSDLNALPFFNGDNCRDNFYCRKEEYVRQMISYWKMEYTQRRGFVRFSIVDKQVDQVIGTFEVFHRDSQEDPYTDCGLLRLDLGSDYEREPVICRLLELMLPYFYDWFHCSIIATKSPDYAVHRCRALETLGFRRSDDPLVSHNKKRYYYDYWVK